MTLLIKNALCFIADEFKKSDVFITDGIITEISSTISSNGADRVIDALDKFFDTGLCGCSYTFTSARFFL